MNTYQTTKKTAVLPLGDIVIIVIATIVLFALVALFAEAVDSDRKQTKQAHETAIKTALAKQCEETKMRYIDSLPANTSLVTAFATMKGLCK